MGRIVYWCTSCRNVILIEITEDDEIKDSYIVCERCAKKKEKEKEKIKKG